MAQRRKKRKPPLRGLVRGWFAQPGQGFYRQGVLHLDCAGRLEVENCRSVEKYSPEEIWLDMRSAVVCIRGNEMILQELAGRTLFIRGRVFAVELREPKEGGKAGGR